MTLPVTFITIYIEVCKTTNSGISFALSFSRSISARYQQTFTNLPNLLIALNKLVSKKHCCNLFGFEFLVHDASTKGKVIHLFTASGLTSK